METRLGLALVPDDIAPERMVPLARACDPHLDDVWVWEDCFKESGIAAAAAILASAERVRVGIGLLPTPLRNVALTAMEVATLARMFPGRLVPGVGHGVQEWMDQVGAKVESPLTLLEEYAGALRRLLAGENVTVEGRYVRLRDVGLHWPPPPVELWAGGTGPKTVALCGRVGDGLLLPWTGRATLAERVKLASETHGGPIPTAVTVIVATGDGAREQAADEARRWFSDPDEPGIVAAGSAGEVAEVIRGQAEAGATTVVAHPTRGADIEGLVEFLGREVRPLLA
ncbi:LLM class flavin-dependent oxidoreductase [Mariniluteicoccus flavus]